jgi:hypothetical protein
MVWIAGLNPGNATNVTFSSIPQTFTHLQLRAFGRTAFSTADWELWIQLNGVGGTSYTYHILFGNGSSASSAGFISQGFARIGSIPGSTATANAFGVSVCDILDYTNTNKNKTIRAIAGFDVNGAGTAGLWSSVYLDTSAITSITVGTANSNFATGSRLDLYGITSSQVTGA